MRIVRVVVFALVAHVGLPGAACPAAPGAAGDREGAERQYRIARRLAAEQSPQAAEALRRVIELDPQGPLADDALLAIAELEGIPEWPEGLGRISQQSATRALSALAEIGEKHPRGDRAVEARYLGALLRLEPLPSRDAQRARVELLTLATRRETDEWSVRARYALVWLDEVEGRSERASNAFQRLVVDDHHDPAAVRSAVGIGRITMRAGLFGIASVWLQQAVERGAPPRTVAADLRDLAVRGVLREQGDGNGWSPQLAERVALGSRSISAVERMPDGGWLVVDRKEAVVSRRDTSGRVVSQWTLDDVAAVSVDRYGRGFVAAGDRVYRLVEGEASDVGSQGTMAPLSAIAVDATGGVWMLDRKGGRVARLDPAGAAPEVIWEGREFRLGDIVWDGRRIVGVDLRGSGLVALGASGGAESLGEVRFGKPIAVAVDSAGQFAVLDGRSREVVVVGPGGDVRARLDLGSAAIEKPAALTLGPDGSLDVLDESSGDVVRIP